MISQKTRFGGVFDVKCFRDGVLLWEDTAFNLVVNVGLQHILDVVFISGTQDTSWFCGLLAATPSVAAADTLASHGGWTEFTSYDETNRVAWSPTRTNQSIANASAMVFTISANSSTVGGAFIAGVTSGTSGTLMCGAAFSGGNKAGLNDGDVLNVTYTFSAADDGV